MLEVVEARESEIHGMGLFARKHLQSGQYLGRFEGDRTRCDGSYVLWVEDDEGREIGIRGRNLLRYVNHGTPPNAEFRADELYALCNVPPGTEVVVDYGSDWVVDSTED